MGLSPLGRVCASLLVLALVPASLLGACVPPAPAPPPRAPAAAKNEAPAPEPAPPLKAPRALAPPPQITAAMPGEPDENKLVEARLSTSSCAELQARAKREAEATIVRMHEELDDELSSYRENQLECMRERYGSAIDTRTRSMAGAGGSSGYGSGYGRLGGSHASHVPRVRMGATVISGRMEPRKAKEHSRTNTQVSDVDEADIVKTDGRYVYFAMNGALRIVEALSPRVVSVTRLGTAAERSQVREMLLEGDRVVVYQSIGMPTQPRCRYGYDCELGSDGTRTKVTVLDVHDRAAPKVVRSFGLSGSFIASRRIGNVVHTVVADAEPERPTYATWPSDMAYCGYAESYVRKRLSALRAENEARIRRALAFPELREKGVGKALCDGLHVSPLGDGHAYTTLASFDMTSNDAPTTATIESRPGTVFASSNRLYMATRHQRGAGSRWYSFGEKDNELTDIHAFRLGDRPSDTKYAGSGVVPGHVLNQLSMDEWYGYLRVATTKGRVPDPKAESVVSVLAMAKNGNLVRVGATPGLAPGEDIRSVRFDEERAYVVTFKKTDPLFVLDLAEPARPKVMGELKIPGFSTYMHRIDPDHLLSIGFDANDHGDFAYFDGVILQMFDVSDPKAPTLIHKEKIGTRGSSSEAAADHLAFTYFAEKGLLGVPITVCEGGGDGRNGGTMAFSGLYVYEVDVKKGFRKLGGVDHGVRGAQCGTWWSNAQSVVKRSLFLDDLVYSVAQERARVQKLSALGTDVASLSLVP